MEQRTVVMVATAEDAAKFVFNVCVPRLSNPRGGGGGYLLIGG